MILVLVQEDIRTEFPDNLYFWNYEVYFQNNPFISYNDLFTRTYVRLQHMRMTLTRDIITTSLIPQNILQVTISNLKNVYIYKYNIQENDLCFRLEYLLLCYPEKDSQDSQQRSYIHSKRIIAIQVRDGTCFEEYLICSSGF